MKKISFSDLFDKFMDIIAPSLTVIILVCLAIFRRPDLIADSALFYSTPDSVVFTIFLCGVSIGTFFCLGLRCLLELMNFLLKRIKKDTTEEVPQ